MSQAKTTFSLLARNAVGNYAATVWLAALPLALLPVYVRVMGPEQWGLIAVCMTAQGLMTLFDFGLSQVMPRDIARVSHDAAATARSYRTYAAAYGLLGACGGALGLLIAPWAAANWIPSDAGPAPGAFPALVLISVQFAFQSANNANLGYWNGLQRQNMANLRQCLFHSIKHGGALVIILVGPASAVTYLLPFASVTALEWWANRRSITRELSPALRSYSQLRSDVWDLARSTGAIGLSIVVGMAAAQIDRVILFKSLDLAEFGRYVAVVTLGIGFLQCQYPLLRALQPHIVIDTRHYPTRRAYLTLAVVAGLPCLVASIAADAILTVWLGQGNLPSGGATLLRLLLLAVALSSIYALTYQYILKHGDGRYLIFSNFAALVASAISVVLTAPSLGPVAGGIGWLAGVMTHICTGWLWVVRRGLNTDLRT